jgi:hypothetical protein
MACFNALRSAAAAEEIPGLAGTKLYYGMLSTHTFSCEFGLISFRFFRIMFYQNVRT